MAKKKAKNKAVGYLPLLAALLGIVALVMMFLPAIGIKDTETTYTGLQTAFGYTESTIIGDLIHLNFSFMNLLTYILVLVAIVFTILGFLGKGNKFAFFIAAIAFIVAGVFFFLTVAFCVPNEGLESLISGIGNIFGEKASVKDSLTLGAGAIIGGILSILSALATGAAVVLKK